MLGMLKITWLVEGRVWLMEAKGQITYPILKAYDDEALERYKNGCYGRYFIADVRQLRGFPTIRQCLQLTSLWHLHLHVFVIIGAQRHPLRVLFLALMHLVRIHYKEVASLADAQAYVMSLDSTLPPLEEWNDMGRDEILSQNE
jgi:hypothetical protein